MCEIAIYETYKGKRNIWDCGRNHSVKIAMALFGAIRPNPFTFEIKRKDSVLCLLT